METRPAIPPPIGRIRLGVSSGVTDPALGGRLPSGKVRDVTRMLKAIHAQEDRNAATEKMRAVIADPRTMKFANAAERIMLEIRKRTRVVGVFPDGKSCLHLAAARLRHIGSMTRYAKLFQGRLNWRFT